MRRDRVNAAEELCNRAGTEADTAPESPHCNPTATEIEALMQTFARETTAMDEYMHTIRDLHQFAIGHRS